MYRARYVSRTSLTEIGGLLGRDHSTVLYGSTVIRKRMTVDPELRGLVACIKAELLSERSQTG
jgi:chromosomal replication initiation ATPase DnaA